MWYVIVIAPLGGHTNRYIPPRGAISVHSPLLGGSLLCTSIVNHNDVKETITRTLMCFFACTYSIVASIVQVAVYSWTHIPYVASEHYHVKTESSQENKGLPHLFSSAKPKKAVAGKENGSKKTAPIFILLMKLRLGHLGALRFLHAGAR